jgi:RNA-directed DNA polymerase
MKRKNNLYQDMCNYKNIKEVYKIIRVRCSNYKYLYNFELFENSNIYDILLKLYLKNYEFSKYHIFLIYEPKYRLIMSECISDKIVNHLISMYILYPSILPKLIDTNVATRKNMGSKKALDCLNKYLQKLLLLKNKEIYVLKIDIKKYFYNIDHEILLSKLKKDIKDKDAINIIMQTLNMTNNKYINEEIKYAKNKEINRILRLNISKNAKLKKIKEIGKIPFYQIGKGLGIGNMTSQILAIYYLNDIDHMIKEKFKCKYYIRYMDDLIILDNDKEKLKMIFTEIKEEIQKLKLEVNDKSRIYKLNHGFSFLGYTFRSVNGKLNVRINNNTYRRIKKNLKKKSSLIDYKNSLISYKGLFMRVSNKGVYQNLINFNK